jgi:hypothetical protein
VQPILLIKNGVSFLITRRVTELSKARVGKPRVFPRVERVLRCYSIRGLFISVFIIVKTRKVILTSLLLRVVRTCYAEDYRPRLEEVFCGELTLKSDYE